MADPVNPSASEGSSQQNFDAQVLDDLTVLQQTGGTTGALGGVQGDGSERIVNEGDKDDPSLLHEPPAKVAQASDLQSEQNSVVNTVLAGGVMEAGQGRTLMPSSEGGVLDSSATTGAVDGVVADTDAAEPVRATNAMPQVAADQAVAPGPSDVPTPAATPRAGVMGAETVATDNTAETAGPSTTTQMNAGTVADPINMPVSVPVPGPTSAPESAHANNGVGNGDQTAPGQSATHNNAENDANTTGDTNKGGSAHAGGSDANNGFGNGDQAAPGQSAMHNNAENDANTNHANASESDAAHMKHGGGVSGSEFDELDLAILLPQGDASADHTAYAVAMGDNETYSPVVAEGHGSGPSSWVEAANNAHTSPVESGHAFDSTTETINFSSDAHGGGHNWEVQDTHGHS